MLKTGTRILGIDPGSRITGYGIIDTNGFQHRYVHSGFLKLTGDELPARLGQIFCAIGEIITEWQPVTMGIEKVFVSKNADSALKLGHARSAVICAAVNAELEIGEYTPRVIKKAVIGNGAADKKQIQMMMHRMLGLDSEPQSDEADALAIAICHANHIHIRQSGIATGSRGGRWV